MNKVLVNGFFRSGTSAVWENIKQSNLDAVVYYEPCHPSLVKFIVDSDGVNSLHGMKLWQEYSTLKNDILSNHPYVGRSAYGERVNDYIKVFEEKARENGKKLVLQSNRWHFELNNFIKNDYKVIHVVRSPRDVYLSMRKAYFEKETSFFLLQLKKILINYKSDGFWEFGELLDFLMAAYPAERIKHSKLRNSFSMNLEEKFVLIWTLVNFIAIHAIENNPNATILSYNSLGDGDASEKVFNLYQLDWDKSYFKQSVVNEADNEHYKNVAERLGLSKEFDKVMNYIS